MKVRIISAVILLPLVMLMLYYGNLPLIVTLCVATIIGLHEFYKAVGMKDALLKALSVILALAVYVIFYFEWYVFLNVTMVVFVVLCLAVYALKFPKISLNQLSYVAFACIYIIYLLLHIALVRDFTEFGNWFVWLIFVIAFGSDSSAYFVGVTMGKHKLVPKLSPKKTIEGAIGGVIGAGILATVFAYIMYTFGPIDNLVTVGMFFVVGAVGSMVSQVGDLVGSAMKRQTNIKDFGKIIPGHGGILDRLDSILVTAPYVYLAIRILF